MPLALATPYAAGTDLPCPVLSIHDTVQIKLDVSNMTTAEVDINGYLKPGVPLRNSSDMGVLVSAGSQVIYGITIGHTKIAASNVTGILAAAADVLVTVQRIGIVNRDVVEDNLGRVLSADELAAFDAAGCSLRLTTT